MNRTETTIVIIALLLGILSTLEVIKILDSEYFILPYIISIIVLAIYYLIKDKTSIYTILFGLGLLTQVGAILKVLHLNYAALLTTVGLIASIFLFLYFVIRPIKAKEKKGLNFYLITGISILVISQWIDIIVDPGDINTSMILNIVILMLIGLLKVFSRPKNKMNQFEFDILTYNFVVLFIGTLNYFN